MDRSQHPIGLAVRSITALKGPFELLALFMREDGMGKWDLLVCAKWIEKNPGEALRLIVKELKKVFSKAELLELSHIQIIERNNPGLNEVHDSMNIPHGGRGLRNESFFGLRIERAFIITSHQPTDRQEQEQPH